MKAPKILLLIALSSFVTLNSFAQTWTRLNVLNTNWYSTAVSADGSIIYAVGGSTNENLIYFSTNSGTTWNLANQPTNHSAFGIALSGDGNTICVGKNLV